MEHEFKIIYKFDVENNTISPENCKIYLDGNQLGLVQNLEFKVSVKSKLPIIKVNYKLKNIEQFQRHSSAIQKSYVHAYKILKEAKIIKSDILSALGKYINLKAFW